MAYAKKTLNINGVDRMFIYDRDKDTLAGVLRRLGLTGTKVGCGTGVCGACSVILDGKVIRSCVKKMHTVKEYSEIITIEGIGSPNHLHPLQTAWMNRGAVQCGFCTPGFIVSSFALLNDHPNPSREDVRDWFQKHRNVCRCTGYKPIVDAVMDAAKVLRGESTIEEIQHDFSNEKEYYGKPLIRPAALGKVCGLTDYGDDITLKMPPGTLHAVIVQPKAVQHAEIIRIDTEEAEKMPGVVKVVTHKDIKGTNRLNLALSTKRSTKTTPTTPILCDKKISRYGDAVAIVVADTLENARAAAAIVKVELETLPAYTNYLEAAMPDADRIHSDSPNIYAMQPVLKGAENVPSILETSAFCISGSFYSTRQPHLSIEGDTSQAYFDDEGILTIQCKTQAIGAAMNHIPKALGLPQEKVRIIENPTGGSFGWSVNTLSFALAGAAAVATNRPIALSMSYEEHQHFSGKRSASYSNGRLACDSEGRLTALEFDCGLDHGAYVEGGDVLVGRVGRFMLFPYHVPNVAGLVRISSTNEAHGVAFRGFGAPQIYTISEALIDMLADKAGIDPFEFRWRNIARPGEKTINNYPYRQYPMEEIMQKLKPYYEKAMTEAKKAATPEIKRGIGLAWGGYTVSAGVTDKCSVALELNQDNTITKYDTWQDVGQGGDIGSLMVTLEALKPLGPKPEQIKLVQNDSKICPDSGISGSSRSHFMNGNATKMAAEQLLNAMRKEDGTYRTYDDMIAEGLQTKYVATYSNTSVSGLLEIDPNTGEGDPVPSLTYSLFLAEVQVDAKTGKVTVLRLTCADDVGVIGNIDAVNGQAYGGLSHSVGFALSENYAGEKKYSNIYSSGVPYIKDIPDEMILIHCENPREAGPFGSSGASEAFQSSAHVAILNAIYNACGVRIYDLPATPDKIKAGLEKLAAGEKLIPPKPYFLGSELYGELDDIRSNPV